MLLYYIKNQVLNTLMLPLQKTNRSFVVSSHNSTKYESCNTTYQPIYGISSRESPSSTRRVLCYLKRSPRRGLFFPSKEYFQLLEFSDADWGGCLDTKRLVFWLLFFRWMYSLIAWKSKKQNTVSCSSLEEEYRAFASATRELQWLTYLLNDLN